jgi:hypothetical protein
MKQVLVAFGRLAALEDLVESSTLFVGNFLSESTG